jgi:hypothetical protein
MWYIYTWKCHSETPCITILNKQMYLFFQNEEQQGKTVPIWGFIPVAVEDMRKGWKKVNIIEILHTHVWKWNNKACWNYSKKEGGRKKEGLWKGLI